MTAEKYSFGIWRVLYPRDCSLRNNRFVQHGQYHFGHLLLGRNRLGQYILGVPGGYDQQERFMANMFGFPYFRESRQNPLSQGKRRILVPLNQFPEALREGWCVSQYPRKYISSFGNNC